MATHTHAQSLTPSPSIRLDTSTHSSPQNGSRSRTSQGAPAALLGTRMAEGSAPSRSFVHKSRCRGALEGTDSMWPANVSGRCGRGVYTEGGRTSCLLHRLSVSPRSTVRLIHRLGDSDPPHAASGASEVCHGDTEGGRPSFNPVTIPKPLIKYFNRLSCCYESFPF